MPASHSHVKKKVHLMIIYFLHVCLYPSALIVPSQSCTGVPHVMTNTFKLWAGIILADPRATHVKETILEYSSQEGHLPSSYSHFTYVARDWPESIWFRMSQIEISIPVGSFRLSIWRIVEEGVPFTKKLKCEVAKSHPLPPHIKPHLLSWSHGSDTQKLA